MKTTLLTLLAFFAGTFLGYAQPELTVTAPSPTGATTGLRAPNGTVAHTTMRGVIIVPASELTAIPSGTTITKLNMLLSGGATPGPAGGTIQFYLENTADVTNLKSTTWATAISTMTSVYTGAYALPNIAGPTAQLTLSTGFVYTGGSVYVAYDYAGSAFTSTGAVYQANNSLAGGWKGDVSGTTTPPATLTQSSSFRPCVEFTFVNPFTNELNVTGMAGEKGIFNNTIKTTQTVTSLITNTSVAALTNIPVTLTVAGANPYTVTQSIPSIGAGATTTLLFNNVPTVNLGAQTVTVSIPSDQNNTNNSQTFLQQVQCDTLGYAQSPIQSGGVGFNTGAGLIANGHVIPNNIETYVKSVSNYFPTAATNANNTIKGILMNGAGTIIDSTALITITAGMLGTKQDFDFINGAIDVSGQTIYVGFRQTANATTGYFPFANQDNSYVDPNAAATFPIFGGTPAPLGSGLGYMMIEATLTYGGFDVANSSTGGEVCLGSALTISPTAGYTNYEFFVNGGSVQNGTSATYTTGPLSAATTFNVDITNGACLLSSNTQTITIATALVNNISAGICPGDSYVFGTQTLSTAGAYSDTLLSASGCDSIINLTLSALAPTSNTLNVGICQGDSYQFGTQTLTTAGTYTDVLTNAAGCDSTVTLNLAVNGPTSSTQTLSVCATAYSFNGQVLTASGTYTSVIPNAAGCDSTITLNLTLNDPTINAIATVSGTTLNALSSPPAASFQWIDCATNDPVPGETSATFNPSVNGSYAVVAFNAAGCTDTSSCINVTTIGLDEQLLNAAVQIYPNPAVDVINILSSDAQILSYKIVDGAGRLIMEETLETITETYEFEINSLSEGTYILEINTSKGKVQKAFVKK